MKHNIIAQKRGGEVYAFVYDDQNRQEIIRVLGQFAADPELSFTWYDAAVVSQRMRAAVQVEAERAANAAAQVEAERPRSAEREVRP